MGLTNLLPRTINTTGVSCTGSDGGSNRTYTLPDSGVLFCFRIDTCLISDVFEVSE